MTVPRRPGTSVPAWIAILLTAATAAGGLVYDVTMVSGQVTRDTTDISDMRTDARSQAALLQSIDRRLAQIETRLEILLPTAGIKPETER